MAPLSGSPDPFTNARTSLRTRRPSNRFEPLAAPVKKRKAIPSSSETTPSAPRSRATRPETLSKESRASGSDRDNDIQLQRLSAMFMEQFALITGEIGRLKATLRPLRQSSKVSVILRLEHLLGTSLQPRRVALIPGRQ